MKKKIIIPLFLVCVLFNTGKAQITKEWYFFDQYLLNNGGYNAGYNNHPLSHDTLLFGFIGNGAYHWVYKYTHRQGFIKKTRFTGIGGYIEAADMCIDTLNKNIYTFSRSGPRPPYFKYSHGIVFKLDYDLNILDSTIITYSTLYDPGPMVLKNNKLYVVGHNNNYFNTPEKINITVLDLNLQQLNFKVVSDSSNSYLCKKLIFDNNNNLRLFIVGASNAITTPNNTFVLDTNLNYVSQSCILNRCGLSSLVPNNIIKDASGYTYSFDSYFYTSQAPFYQIYSYHIKVNENEDTIRSTFFPTSFNPNGGPGYGYTNYNIKYLQRIKNKGYLGLGQEVIGGIYNQNKKGIFFILDSSLKITNQFDVLKYTTAQIDKGTVNTTKIGQTGSGMYYLVSEAKDSTQTNYKGVFYMMTIDSSAKIITPTTPTLAPSPEASWENITVYPNPTDDIVHIGLPTGNTYNLNIYNNLGQSLLSIDALDVNRQISLVNLPVGVYHFVFYETGIKKSITKKVIVQR